MAKGSKPLPPKAQAALDKCLRAREKADAAKFDEDPKGPSFLAGLIYDSNGQFDDAKFYYRSAIKGCPENYDAHERLCSALEKQYDEILESYREGNSEQEVVSIQIREVEHAYRKAIELYSNSKKDSVVAMVIRLSAFLLKVDEAGLSLKNTESYLKKVVDGHISKEEIASLHLMRASALLRLGRFRDTLRANQDVLKLFPSSVHYLNSAALAAEKCGEFEEAERYFQESLARNSSHANTFTNYGVFLKHVGKGSRDTEAITLLEKAVQLDPEELESETGHAKIQLASLKPGGFFVESMGRTYVEGLFDGFSSTFDKDLADLRYVGHELVAAHVLQSCRPDSPDNPWFRVLDIGCGTGLFGAALKKMYQGPAGSLHLTGVDLSARMLATAEKTNPGVYSGGLIHADVHAHLEHMKRSGEPRVDAVGASDVLIYIGDVDRLFAGVRDVLKERGVFCFTIEVVQESSPVSPLVSHEQQKAGYWLLQSGRFGHKPDYIDQMARKHGFTVLAKGDTPIRTQHQAPVMSATYCLVK